MTKSKPDWKAKPKRIISTSAVFKHVKPRQWVKGETSHGQSKRRKVEKGHKNTSNHKHKQTREHPLAVAFAANIARSRNHLQEQAENAIDVTCQDLTQRITSSSSQFAQTMQSIKTTNDGFLKAVSKDELHFISNDGKAAGTQVLGDRMKRFQKVIATEEKELEALSKQWTDVQQKILDLATEVGAINGLPDTSPGDIANHISPEQQTMAEELEKGKKRWEDEIAKANKKSIAKLQSSEEETNKTYRKQMASLLTLMAADI